MSNNWEWVPHETIDKPKSYKESVWARNKKRPPISETDEIAIFHDAYPATDNHRLYIPKINRPHFGHLTKCGAFKKICILLLSLFDFVFLFFGTAIIIF